MLTFVVVRFPLNTCVRVCVVQALQLIPSCLPGLSTGYVSRGC